MATLPDNMKIRDGVVKHILKKTMERILPEGITRRPKEGFVLPVFDWMTGKLKEFSVDMLSEEKLKKHDLLNRNKVNYIISKYYSGEKQYAGQLWNLLMFQIWWERYFSTS